MGSHSQTGINTRKHTSPNCLVMLQEMDSSHNHKQQGRLALPISDTHNASESSRKLISAQGEAQNQAHRMGSDAYTESCGSRTDSFPKSAPGWHFGAQAHITLAGFRHTPRDPLNCQGLGDCVLRSFLAAETRPKWAPQSHASGNRTVKMPFFLGRRAMLGRTKKANMATEETCPITLSLARETKPSAAAMWLGDFLSSSEGRG